MTIIDYSHRFNYSDRQSKVVDNRYITNRHTMISPPCSLVTVASARKHDPTKWYLLKVEKKPVKWRKFVLSGWKYYEQTIIKWIKSVKIFKTNSCAIVLILRTCPDKIMSILELKWSIHPLHDIIRIEYLCHDSIFSIRYIFRRNQQ